MKKYIILVLLFMITGCTQFMANVAGMEFLHDRRSREVISIDSRIEKRAYNKIAALSELKQKTHVKINAYNGKVLVTGEAETVAIRDKVVANIRVIENIRVIYNELVIEPLMNDSSINRDGLIGNRAEDVLRAIKSDSGFDETRVKVIVSAANVYLMGLLYKEEANVVATHIQKIENIRNVITLFEYIEQE